jgi:toxin ParE1/3/4
VRNCLFVQQLAEEDLAEQADYIARNNIDAALRFVEAAEAAFSQLADLPDIGRPRLFRHPALAGVRSWPVPGFAKHLIFYRLTPEVLR